MTTPANLDELARTLGTGTPSTDGFLIVNPDDLLAVAKRLHEPLGLDYEYMDMITAVDYPRHFEIIYRVQSLKRNEAVILKTLVNKDKPTVPSLSALWLGANYQEREIYDLFGITFTGHPKLQRMMLWEGFQGYPLRKDYKLDT